MSRQPPKRYAQPAAGLTLASEPDEAKGLRLLGALRWMTERKVGVLGITVGDAQFMVVRYRPQPDGPHAPDADLSGQEL